MLCACVSSKVRGFWGGKWHHGKWLLWKQSTQPHRWALWLRDYGGNERASETHTPMHTHVRMQELRLQSGKEKENPVWVSVSTYRVEEVRYGWGYLSWMVATCSSDSTIEGSWFNIATTPNNPPPSSIHAHKTLSSFCFHKTCSSLFMSTAPIWHLPPEQHFSPTVWSLIGFMCRLLLLLVTCAVIKERTLCSFCWKHNIRVKSSCLLINSRFTWESCFFFFLKTFCTWGPKNGESKHLVRYTFKWRPYAFVLFIPRWSHT